MSRETSLVVLSDFDGTITPVQTMEFLYSRFAACGLEFARRWDRGEISTMEEITSTFATVQASREEMEQALDTIPLEDGFLEFFHLCRDLGHPFAIVSDGLEWYIRHILQRHGLEQVPVYANQIHFGEDGFRFTFPWSHPDQPMRGVSKPRIIRIYHDRGYRVAFIGDGRSDTDALDVADLIFARGWLAEHCRAGGIRAEFFENWQDLSARWPQISRGHRLS
ncbi:MAG TPA: hypothetical protein ENL35_10410 [Chloroflexi bacterium]|nr:hypothetical protein [Chloroflexota bacterium]